MVAPWRWFARTFGIAVIAHLAGNPVGWRGDEFGGSVLLIVASGVLATSSFALLIRPDPRILGATAALVLIVLWLELPVTGNHWLLAGFVAVAVLISLTTHDPWAWFSVTGRWILLGFYSFAAFAKLNSGFLDPSVSCGVFYANQSLASFGLPTFDGATFIGTLAIAGPVMTELSVPILLAFTRTRRVGVVLALVFHTIISLDFDQHFYDFTAALVMLLCLFLPESTTAGLEARASRHSRVRVVALVVVATVLASSLAPHSFLPTVVVVRLLGFGVWVPFAVWIIFRVARDGLGPSPLPMRLPGVAAFALVAIVVVNGMTPYLELKTSLSFNMYANLRTVAGESNHLVVRRTLHLSDVQDDLVEIVSSDDPDLEQYAEDGYLIPRRNLLDYLDRHPDMSVVVQDEDGRRNLHGTDGVRVPAAQTKIQVFRSVDEQDPPRCQAQWLPAL
jgi:hypothetical protein